MNTRKEFIMAKYMERKYVQKATKEDPCRVWEAIRSRDLLALLQAFAEGHNLSKPLVSPEGQEQGEPALHWAVRYANKTSLPLVDFIIQNGTDVFHNLLIKTNRPEICHFAIYLYVGEI
uniref:Uncharacterized protein n=1 Tax=Micrurus lemniscatus lemniscatus TaxID=129467 RepID=A0A2D4JS04_MICLE